MSEKKDYVDRDEVVSNLEQLMEHYEDSDDIRIISKAIAMVNDATAADVEPVVLGELRISEQGYLECSACGKTLRMPLVSTHEMKRCYICGAYLERSGSGEREIDKTV